MASSWTRRMMGVAIVFATFLTCIPAFAQTGGLTGKCTGTEARPWRATRSRLSAPKSNGVRMSRPTRRASTLILVWRPGSTKSRSISPDGKTMYFISRNPWGSATPRKSTLTWRRSAAGSQESGGTNPEYQKQVAEQKQSTKFEADVRPGTRALCAEAIYGRGRRLREGSAACQRQECSDRLEPIG